MSISFTLALTAAVAVPAIAGDEGPAQAPRARRHQVALPGTNTVIGLWEARDATGRVAPHFQVFRGGEPVGRARATSYVLELRYAAFDPLADEQPWTAPVLTADERTAGVYLVQFLSPPLEEFRQDIRAAGGTIYKYVANHAYVVAMDPVTYEIVRALPYVRWVGPLHPAYRLEESLLDALERNQPLPLQRYNIGVFERGMGQKQAIADLIADLGGQVDVMHPDGFLLQATLSADQLAEVVRRPEVLFIDLWGPTETDMNNAREIGGANYIRSQRGWDGQGMHGETRDTNLFDAHQDFQARPPIFHGAHSGSNSHGTQAYGVGWGDGTGNSQARGMHAEGQGIFADSGVGGNRYTHTAELLQLPYTAVYQTNSTGDPRTFFYTNVSAQMDDILFIYDVLHCQSQSNAGNQDSRPQAWAKNIVSGGGVRHFNTLTKADDRWNFGASIGPASDGRVKPTFTHFYDSVLTTANTGGYGNFSGTSSATPITCGHFGLMFQMWGDGVFCNEVDPQGTVFENRPHMSTARALMINSAVPYPFPPQTDMTRFHQGWGMVDLRNLYDRRDTTFVVDETDLLQQGESTVYQIPVESGNGDFRVTMVYTDPMGVPFSNVHRINDLTLKVTSPGGTVYWGNHNLMDEHYSLPGGSADTINVEENVFIQDPVEIGTWMVEVIADEINEDSHVETQEVDADYALVVSGAAVNAADAPANAFRMEFGSLISGGLPEIAESDDTYLHVRSFFGINAFEPNLSDVVIELDTTAQNPRAIDLRIEHRSNQVATLKIRLKNWQTGQFETVEETFSFQQDSITVTGCIPVENYISQDGRIELSLKQVARFIVQAQGFDSFYDEVRVQVR